MAMEDYLKRIATALETIAGALNNLEVEVPASTGTPAKETPPAKEEKKADPPKKDEKPADDGAVPDLDTVVKALQAYMKANGRDAAVELLGKYEAKRASDIAEDKRAAFMKEAS